MYLSLAISLLESIHSEMTIAKNGTFRKVKKLLHCLTLLENFDNCKEIVVACDVCFFGLGAVLCHDTLAGDRCSAFASRSLIKV